MSKFTVFFGRTDAIKYQKFILEDMIKQAESDLQCLQEYQSKQSQLKQMVTDATEVWEPMSDILLPTNNFKLASKNVKYQRRLIAFMQAKVHAADLLINQNADPKVIF